MDLRGHVFITLGSACVLHVFVHCQIGPEMSRVKKKQRGDHMGNWRQTRKESPPKKARKGELRNGSSIEVEPCNLSSHTNYISLLASGFGAIVFDISPTSSVLPLLTRFRVPAAASQNAQFFQPGYLLHIVRMGSTSPPCSSTLYSTWRSLSHGRWNIMLSEHGSHCRSQPRWSFPDYCSVYGVLRTVQDS